MFFHSPQRCGAPRTACRTCDGHTARSARCEQARAPLPVLSEQSESCCLHQKSRGLRLGFLLSATVLRAAVPPHALRRNRGQSLLTLAEWRRAVFPSEFLLTLRRTAPFVRVSRISPVCAFAFPFAVPSSLRSPFREDFDV